MVSAWWRRHFINIVDVFQVQEKLLELILETGKVLHEPYVTTKHGKLRSKRKSNNDPIAVVDDLALLEDLEEV